MTKRLNIRKPKKKLHTRNDRSTFWLKKSPLIHFLRFCGEFVGQKAGGEGLSSPEPILFSIGYNRKKLV